MDASTLRGDGDNAGSRAGVSCTTARKLALEINTAQPQDAEVGPSSPVQIGADVDSSSPDRTQFDVGPSSPALTAADVGSSSSPQTHAVIGPSSHQIDADVGQSSPALIEVILRPSSPVLTVADVIPSLPALIDADVGSSSAALNDADVIPLTAALSDDQIGPATPARKHADVGLSSPNRTHADVGPSSPVPTDANISPSSPSRAPIAAKLGPSSLILREADVGPLTPTLINADMGPSSPGLIDADVSRSPPTLNEADVGPSLTTLTHADDDRTSPPLYYVDDGPSSPTLTDADVNSSSPALPDADIGPSSPSLTDADVSSSPPALTETDVGPSSPSLTNANISLSSPALPDADIGPSLPTRPNADTGPSSPARQHVDVGPSSPSLIDADVSPSSPSLIDADVSPSSPALPDANIGTSSQAHPLLETDVDLSSPINADVGHSSAIIDAGVPNFPALLDADVGPSQAIIYVDEDQSSPSLLDTDVGPSSPSILEGDVGPSSPSILEGDVGPSSPSVSNADVTSSPTRLNAVVEETPSQLIAIDQSPNGITVVGQKPTRPSAVVEQSPILFNAIIRQSPAKFTAVVDQPTQTKFNAVVGKSSTGLNAVAGQAPTRINAVIKQLLNRLNAGAGQAQTGLNAVVEQSPTRVNAVVEQSPTRLNAVVEESPTRFNAVVEESPTQVNAVVKQSPNQPNAVVEQSPSRVNAVVEESPPRLNAVVEESLPNDDVATSIRPSRRTARSLINQMKATAKKYKKRVTFEQNDVFTNLNKQNQVGHFLMPDAPPKKARQTSPVRMLCPLTPGTPSKPPKRTSQPWQMKRDLALEKERSGINNDEIDEGPPKQTSPFRVPCPRLPGTPPKPKGRLPKPPARKPWAFCQEASQAKTNSTTPKMDSSNIIDLVDDNSPGKSSASCMPRSVQPGPSAKPPAYMLRGTKRDRALRIEHSRMNGVMMNEVPPMSIVQPITKRQKVVRFAPIPSSVEVDASLLEPTVLASSDTSVFDAGLERQLVMSQHDTGSDPESDDDDISSGTRCRHVGEFLEEELSEELRQMLQDLDHRDDRAMFQLASPDMLTFEWSSSPETFLGKRETFIGPCGPTFNVTGLSPFQILQQIWDERLINHIVRETNRYGEIVGSCPGLSVNSKLKRWVPVTPQELWIFLGILMLQSIVPIPVESEYWTPCLSYLKIGNFSEIMHYNRFILIKRCLHFVDNLAFREGIPDKLFKIKPLIDYLCNKFRTLYLPGQEIAIDESLLQWNGKLSFAQLIKNKTVNIGIKSIELCESKTGYLWNMFVYSCRRRKTKNNAQDDYSDLENTKPKIILDLVRPLLKRGHTLVMDNFSTSPLLARTLKALGTDVLGGLRLSRHTVPPTLRCSTSSLPRGEAAGCHTRDLAVTAWRDCGVLALLATYQRADLAPQRHQPPVVRDYHQYMGGLDVKDRLLHAFPMERCKNTVWYKKLFRRLLNVSIQNAFILSQANPLENITVRQFRVRLVDEILRTFRPPSIVAEPPLPGGHFVERLHAHVSCKWCYSQGRTTKTTRFKCTTCNAALCIDNCYRDFHKYNYPGYV